MARLVTDPHVKVVAKQEKTAEEIVGVICLPSSTDAL
jgi:hypothetical protein